MKRKLLSMLLSVCMVAATVPVMAFAADSSYSDTDGHWAEAAINRWSDAGVVKGVTGDTFNPNGDMTRAQAAQVFANLLKLKEKADISQFKDVAVDAWYTDAIAACAAKGILSGVSADEMNPNGTMTREMFFVMFARALNLSEEAALDKEFTDAGQISSWAQGSVYALINNGFVSGVSADTIAPRNDINRASVVSLLNQTIVCYAVENGEVTADKEGVILILADDVTVKGDADVTVVVAAADAKISLKDYKGKAAVIVSEDNVAISDAPAGTEIEAAENVTGVTANGTGVSEGTEITIPDKSTSGGGSSGGSGGGSEPAVNAAQEATDKAWSTLKTELEKITGNNGDPLVTASSDEKGAYQLTLNVDAIQAGSGAFEDDFLNGLATRIGEALKANFGSSSIINADGKPIYVNGEIQNTTLKETLVSIADGFFYTLANMEPAEDGIYTYKTVKASVKTGSDTYEPTLAIQLKGDDVAKVKELASVLEKHLQMEMLSKAEISARYGVDVAENQAAVVTMEMPDALMRKAAEIAESKNLTAATVQSAFDDITIEAYLNKMAGFSLDDILGSGQSSVNSVLSTVNSNANLINKILSKMTVSVNETELFDSAFAPGSEGDSWKNFMSGVQGMISDDILKQKPADYKVNTDSAYKDVYYAVPVKMHVDLESSLGFIADETVVVVLHIDFSKYMTDDAQGTENGGTADIPEVPSENEDLAVA